MKEKLNKIRENVTAMPFNKKAILGMALATTVGVTTATGFLLSQPSYVRLMGDLEPASMQTIIPVLEAEGIPFTISADSKTLMVDEAAVQRATTILAKHGLPAQPMSGYDHLGASNSPYMTKNTEEQISRQILEENLEKSILELNAVQKAKVRLALAKNSQFLRDVESAKASVVLTLKSGKTLNKNQINGIAQMIAFSVPNLPIENVIILDHTGRALSNGGDSIGGTNGSSATDHKHMIEDQLKQKIIEVVAPIVGLETVRVNVEAHVNFDKVENTKEEPVAASVILSQQTEKSYDAELAGGGGVVGAVSNQPPNHAKFEESASGKSGDQSKSESGISHIKETTNYSVGKSITHTVKSAGELQRINIAILFDQSKFTAEELPNIIATVTSLAQSSSGFSAERGDIVDVKAMTFATPDAPAVEEIPLYETPLAKDAIEAGKWLGAVLLLWLLFWRPLMNRLSSSENQKFPEDTSENDEVLNPESGSKAGISTEATEADYMNEKSKAIEALTTQPTEAQNVMQSWLLDKSLKDLLNIDDEDIATTDETDDSSDVDAEDQEGEKNEK